MLRKARKREDREIHGDNDADEFGRVDSLETESGSERDPGASDAAESPPSSVRNELLPLPPLPELDAPSSDRSQSLLAKTTSDMHSRTSSRRIRKVKKTVRKSVSDD